MTSFEDARAGAQSERALPRLGPPLRSPAGKRLQGQATPPVSDHRVASTLQLGALMAPSPGGVDLQLATEGGRLQAMRHSPIRT
jgi:hypothetical protein